MYSSRQIPLFSPELSSGGAAGAALQQTDIRIDDIKLHAVPRLSDYLSAELSYYDNVFQRTKMGRIARPRGAAGGPAAGQRDQRSDQLSAKSLSVGAEAVTYNQLIHDNEAVLLDIVRRPGLTKAAKAFVRAGPRAKICWAEGEVVAAIVTCGGLCPGLNDVIAELFHTLYYGYGVDRVYGIRSGFRGFHDSAYGPWMELLPEGVKGIYEQGGTVLGSSRGGFDISRILAACRNRGVNQLYIIGGDGTHRAANALYLESRQRRLKLTVAGIPKTIDNDIGVIDRSFGFNTAVAEARKAIQSAVVEASCAPRGLGIVQLMGRHAGYIAAHATLASRQVDLCLIPEVPFPLEGELGLLALVEQILDRQNYGVIVVAEGAGADLFPPGDEKDESGNQRLPEIGKFLQQQIQQHFRRQHKDVSIKYHDQSYMIRSVPADAGDSVY
jgi:6-phosphofructokinase 1